MSNNLNTTALTTGQTGKVARINATVGALDAAITENMEVDLTSGDETITATQFRGNVAFIVTNATVVGREITVPVVKGFKIICNDATNTEDFTLVQGSSAVIFVVGSSGMIYSDGTTNGLHAVGTGA